MRNHVSLQSRRLARERRRLERQQQQRPPPAAARPTPPAAAAQTKDTFTRFQILLVCAYLLQMILPPNLDYGALVDSAANVTNAEGVNVTTKFVVVLVLGGSFILIMKRPRLWLQELLALNSFYLLFLILATLSLVWSISPDITARGLLRLFTGFVCFTTFTLYDWRNSRFQDVVRPLYGALCVGSVVFAALIPHYGVQQFSDFATLQPGQIATISSGQAIVKPVLRGLTFGKNQMGQLASIGLVIWFHAWLGKDVKTRWAALVCGCSVIGLWWAHSSTSILAAAFALPMLLMLRHWPTWLRRYVPYILTSFAILILGYSVVVLRLIPQLDFLLTPITAITGKDLTFSARTSIWAIIGEHIAKHPLAGTGYLAYWSEDDPNSPSQIFRRVLFFYPGESHNGYIEVVNDLGIIGGVCLFGFLFTYLRQSIKIMSFDRHVGSLYVVILFHQFWSSLSESHWFNVNSVSFTIMMLATCCIGRTLLQRRFDLSGVRDDSRPPDQAPAGRLNSMRILGTTVNTRGPRSR